MVRDQDQAEVRSGLRGPEHRALVEHPPTGTLLTAIRSADGRRLPEKMRFGLIPRWAKDPKMAFSTFNARAESVTEKPAFRDAWRRAQRCLVVTEGFYEWRKSDRQPFAIGMADAGLMTMAGLWDEWRDPLTTERLRSCTTITTSPNELMATLHDRMPVILDERDWPKYLGEEPASETKLRALLVPCPSESTTQTALIGATKIENCASTWQPRSGWPPEWAGTRPSPTILAPPLRLTPGGASASRRGATPLSSPTALPAYQIKQRPRGGTLAEALIKHPRCAVAAHKAPASKRAALGARFGHHLFSLEFRQRRARRHAWA
jgi:putative SOS response-associated peptidase YedK